MARQPLRDGSWTGRRRQALVALCLATKGRTCHLCGQPGATTADHIVPRSKGGSNDPDNLAPAHYSCNSARGDRTLAEWWAARPALAAAVHGRTPAALPPSRDW